LNLTSKSRPTAPPEDCYDLVKPNWKQQGTVKSGTSRTLYLAEAEDKLMLGGRVAVYIAPEVPPPSIRKSGKIWEVGWGYRQPVSVFMVLIFPFKSKVLLIYSGKE
jgi:hypothetical protein